ncbi:MAG: ankyrin repeat domain-containing protein [Candidatus Acidiferrales bacterium]
MTTLEGPASGQLWLDIAGIGILAGSTVLTVRLVWEQTVWTWEQGPQNVGYSLAHGAGAILLLFSPLLIVWTVLALAIMARSFIKRRRILRLTWVALSLALLLLASLAAPEGFWERVFIRQMARSPYVGDLMVSAAYRGDLGAVRDFVSHGVSVNVTDYNDLRTAVHAAAVKGDTKELRYLISKGANINALDRFGDSPLELAESGGSSDAADFLTGLGAKRIRGDDAQRKKAIQKIVQADIKRLNQSEGPQK